MSFSSISYPQDKGERYSLILDQAKALTFGITHPIANMANISALLWQALPEINWCGFYLLNQGILTLGPFCGLPACIEIPLGRGVCGTAAMTDRVQLVTDVHQFPGHIACDSASSSEIVIPIHSDGHVIGVLDIDSPKLARFDETDQRYLTQLVAHIESACDFNHTLYTLN